MRTSASRPAGAARWRALSALAAAVLLSTPTACFVSSGGTRAGDGDADSDADVDSDADGDDDVDGA